MGTRWRGARIAVALAALTLFVAGGCGDTDDSPKKSRDTPAPSPPQQVTPQPSPSPSPASALAGKTIVVDPGHNRRNHLHTAEINKKVDAGNGTQKPCNTTGTQTNDGYTEAEFTWDTSQRLAALLRSAGANVILTVADDTPWGPCVDERAKIGNTANATAVISLHADGGPASGSGFHVMETSGASHATSSTQAASQRLAVAIRDAYRSEAGMQTSNYIGQDGLNPRTDMAGLNLSTVPIAMLESGNMRNSADAAKLKDPAFRQRLAQSLVTALRTYLG